MRSVGRLTGSSQRWVVLDIFRKETQAHCSELKGRVKMTPRFWAWSNSKRMFIKLIMENYSYEKSAIALFSNDGDKSHCENSISKELSSWLWATGHLNRTQLIKFHTCFCLYVFSSYFIKLFCGESYTHYVIKSMQVGCERFKEEPDCRFKGADFKQVCLLQTASY